MSKKNIAIFGGVLALAVLGVAIFFVMQANPVVFDPRGMIARQERDLMVFTLSLSLLVVVPVFTMLFFIAWKYRAGNTKAKYQPDWDHNKVAETIWWVVPLAIITVLAVVTWQSSHALDPYRPIANGKKPLTIQVVALQWKWLFIYPEQGVASVNAVYFPDQTPINFQITADAPMNSFWIPQLGGQIYAMTGMSTSLHLMADAPGNFAGSSANISGRGFAGMRFVATATSQSDFDAWVDQAKQSNQKLDQDTYHKLAAPSENNPPAHYAPVEEGLYNSVINKYMAPAGSNAAMEAH